MSFFKKPQSDWSQADTKELSYIKNKPALKPVATSGDYNDLDNKLKAKTDGGITIEGNNEISLASEVQIPVKPDWGETEEKKLSFIQHKPALKPVATSGDYNDLENKLKEKEGGGIKINGDNEISYTPPDKSQHFKFTILKDGFDTFLMRPRRDFAIAKIGNFVVMAGGVVENDTITDTVDVVDVYEHVGNTLIPIKSPSPLSVARCRLAATTVGDYVIFAGGMNSSFSSLDTVDVYKLNGGELVKYENAVSPLSEARSYLAATTVGNYVIFAGGHGIAGSSVATVDVYKVDGGELVKYENAVSPLSEARSYLAATTVGNYAIFAGGADVADSSVATVDVYKVDGGELVKYENAVSPLSEARYSLAATTVGNYAIFAGGADVAGSSVATVDVYKVTDGTLKKDTNADLSLSEARSYLAATTVGNYAIFAGGIKNGAPLSTVDVYKVTDGTLKKDTNADLSLSKARSDLAATTVGNYAIFAGGYSSAQHSNTLSAVDVYNVTDNGELVKYETAVSPLSEARSHLAATTVGNYAIFAGGGNKQVDVYKVTDGTLKKDTNADLSLSVARDSLAATTVGNYAIFAGGIKNGAPFSTVDVYKVTDNGKLVKYETAVSPLSEARSYLAATTVGNYAIFAGGYSSAQHSNTLSTVDVYKVTDNGELVKYETAVSPLSEARSYLAATTVGNYAIFAGGIKNGAPLYTVDVYKVDGGELVKYENADLSLSVARYSLAATTVGNYVIFAGDWDKQVDVYKVTDNGKLEQQKGYDLSLSEARSDLAATTVRNYAIFAGGYDNYEHSNYLPTVDVYKVDGGELVKYENAVSPLSEARGYLAATTVGNYAIFAGGIKNESGNNIHANTVDVYKVDTALAKECGHLQEIKVAGISADKIGICDVSLSVKEEEEEWRKINKIHTADGSVVVECFDETPNKDLNVIMKV